MKFPLLLSRPARLAALVPSLLRLTGIVGFAWFSGQYALEQAQEAWRDRGCVATIVQRLDLPTPHRMVEVQVHRCPMADPDRPRVRWQAWAVATEPGKEDRRMLIELKHHDAAPATVRWDTADGLVIERFRWSDVRDWEQGRGEGYVPTVFRFIDDNGDEPVDRRLP